MGITTPVDRTLTYVHIDITTEIFLHRGLDSIVSLISPQNELFELFSEFLGWS